ncbi:MAG: DUF268 domain-containing protein [Burkholderiales bacterium]
MNARLKQLARSWMLPFFDPRPLAGIVRLPAFFAEWRAYRRRSGEKSVVFSDLWPCLSDRSARTAFDPHYFYQGAWLARRLAQVRPELHIDCGSSVLMVSVLSAQVPTVFLDYRPLASGLTDVISVAGTLTGLPFADGSLDSVSSLHVIEHVGLARYGDPLDPDGSVRALAELVRIIRPGGHLYLSVPVGRERVCFNAQRIFSPGTIIGLASGMSLRSFALVDDDGRYHDQAHIDLAANLNYGCGMFEFSRSHA